MTTLAALTLSLPSADAYGTALQPGRRAVRHATAQSVASAMPSSLQEIAAAPRSTIAFDVAEALTMETLPVGPWRHAFRNLLQDELFLSHGWARTPFKLREQWDFAVSAYTMADVERDVTRLPPQFVAHGVEHQGGIYNKPMTPGFSFADVDAAMDAATVVMLNAGFVVPKLAAVSLAMLEASQLPIWLNVYLSKAGLERSTQLHTDLQDVLLVQCTGRKRWRVYRPPPPADTPGQSPFSRGKGTDQMARRAEDVVIDTVMEPGQVLYVPAGFPHETDTIGEVVTRSDAPAANEPAVHLTIGIDTHLWGLNYAKMREVALGRAKDAGGTALAGGAPLTTLDLPHWTALHTPLPLGFVASALLRPLCDGAYAAHVAPTEARSALCEGMVMELARRMRAAEPERWAAAAEDDDALVAAVGLRAAAERMFEHYTAVLRVQAGMYRTAAGAMGGESGRAAPSAREQRLAIEAMMREMDRLDDETAALDAWGRGEERAATAEPAKQSGFGGGSGGGAGGKKVVKAKKGKKRK